MQIRGLEKEKHLRRDKSRAIYDDPSNRMENDEYFIPLLKKRDSMFSITQMLKDEEDGTFQVDMYEEPFYVEGDPFYDNRYWVKLMMPSDYRTR